MYYRPRTLAELGAAVAAAQPDDLIIVRSEAFAALARRGLDRLGKTADQVSVLLGETVASELERQQSQAESH